MGSLTAMFFSVGTLSTRFRGRHSTDPSPTHHAYVCAPRDFVGRNTVVRGAAGGSEANSAIVHSSRALRIRARTRHKGSRTLHFANCSHWLSSVEHAVTVTGPSIA